MEQRRKNSPAKPRSAAAERMAAYRARMLAQGLRSVQMWLPDTRDPKVIDRIRRQCAALAAEDPGGEEIMAELEAGGYDWPPFVWPEDR